MTPSHQDKAAAAVAALKKLFDEYPAYSDRDLVVGRPASHWRARAIAWAGENKLETAFNLATNTGVPNEILLAVFALLE